MLGTQRRRFVTDFIVFVQEIFSGAEVIVNPNPMVQDCL